MITYVSYRYSYDPSGGPSRWLPLPFTTSFFQSRISTNRTFGLHDGWTTLSKTWLHGKFLQFGVPAGWILIC